VRWRPRCKGGRRPAAAPLGGGELASGWSRCRRRPRVEPPSTTGRTWACPAWPRCSPRRRGREVGQAPSSSARRWPEDGHPCRQRAGRPGREEGGEGERSREIESRGGVEREKMGGRGAAGVQMHLISSGVFFEGQLILSS